MEQFAKPGTLKFYYFSFLVLCICSSLSGNSTVLAYNHLYEVGYQVVDLPNDRGDQITIAIWYPTDEKPKPHRYGGTTWGMLAINAKPAIGLASCPLFIFSHGYGGSGLAAVYLTEALAARGWIAIAPDHHDLHSANRIKTGQVDNFDRLGFFRHAKKIATSSSQDRNSYRYRLDEISNVFKGIFATEPFCRMIDRNRIAVGGHSFGGYTVLGLCGTIPELEEPNIKAALLLSSGAAGYLYNESELANVKIPVMFFLGQNETKQKRGKKTMYEIVDKLHCNFRGPWYFLEIKDGNHFTFNNCLIDSFVARNFFSGREQQFEVIRRYAIAFLEKYVLGNSKADNILSRRDSLLTRLEIDLRSNNVKIE